jgi:serine/threonine protein kinase
MVDQDTLTLNFREGIVSEAESSYNVLQELGRGGNAITYLMVAGSGPFQGTPFAVKIFRRVSKPERRESFLNEAQFLRDCGHPGVMRIYDEGVYRDDHPFVVAEYLPHTLAEVIRSSAATIVEKLSYTLQLLSTLDYLSALGEPVIHRDIKPQNVFVKGQSCVLGDFGLMKRVSTPDDDVPENVIKESVGPGMPFFYRTPDLVAYVRGEAYPTTKSDVFQLGLVVAQLFTGRNPECRAENNAFKSDVELEPLAPIPGSYCDQIANLVDSMLELDPANRPTAGELLPAWRGLFFDAAEQLSALEGRVF